MNDENWHKEPDLEDQDILTERKCPKCGERIVIQPDCVEYCSNDDCDYEKRQRRSIWTMIVKGAIHQVRFLIAFILKLRVVHVRLVL